MKKERNKGESKHEIMYPSAEMLHLPCFEDYKRVIDTYDKIYGKVNAALAFCGAILLVVINNFDYRIFLRLLSIQSNSELFQILLLLVFSITSLICIVWAVTELISMMRSKTLEVFDSVDVRNEKIYRLPPDEAALWLIDKYTYVTNNMREINDSKQKKYDFAMIRVLISVLSYSVVLIVSKGV